MADCDSLQLLCRKYLKKLQYMGRKHGIDIDAIIRANKRKECVATNKEVEMLSRMVDDERVSRKEVPFIVGKSYRECCNDGTFDRIKTLKRVGIYSKVSALLYKRNKKSQNGLIHL